MLRFWKIVTWPVRALNSLFGWINGANAVASTEDASEEDFSCGAVSSPQAPELQADSIAMRLADLPQSEIDSETRQLKEINPTPHALVSRKLTARMLDKKPVIPNRELQKIMQEGVTGQLTSGVVKSDKDGQLTVEHVTDEVGAGIGLTIPLSTVPQHCVGGGAVYTNPDGTHKSFKLGQRLEPKSLPVVKVADGTSTTSRKDNSKFPEFLKKVHEEVMGTAEGRRAKAREQAELDYVAEKAEQGRPVKPAAPHRRTIPVDSYPCGAEEANS